MRPEAGERDDAALLRAVARGDEDALAALYDRHAGWLTVRLTRRCAMPDVVDHAVQDTFLAVWREAGAYRGGGDVAAFIWGIGVRRLIDAIRRDNGPRWRLPWRATVLDGLTCAEAAVLLGVAEGTVKSRCHRARVALRAALAEQQAGPDTRAHRREAWGTS
jgi:RNA polymerase sigma-70 factor, ECF subfamily